MRISDWSSDVCSSDLKPAAAVPSRASKVSRKALAKSDEAQVVQRPDMDTLVKTDTVAEAVDVMSFQGRAESVPSSVLERFEQDAKPARAAMNDAIRQEGKSRRSEEHTSELQSLMRISYAAFCLKKKIHRTQQTAHERQRIK